MKMYKKPLILAGRGVRASGTIDLFRKFVQKYKIPVVTSLLGLDALPYSHPQRVGFIGIYGNRWANYTLGNCDYLLALGTRMDVRQVASGLQTEIIHIDIEKGVNLSDFFKSDIYFPEVPLEWLEDIKKEREKYPDIKEIKTKGINPNVFIHQLSKVSQRATAYTADVGSNQMWTAQSLELNDNQLFLTSGGMGAMGYSLPAAIGASITMGNSLVVAIAGDGGIQINIQELQTIKRNNLPIKIIVLNNQSLGMIRQFQDAYFGSRYQSTVWDYSAPDFTKIATAYGIESSAISKPDEIEDGLGKLWHDPYVPYLLDVSIDIDTDVSPKVMFGNYITQMNAL